jgi:hypothetical protein
MTDKRCCGFCGSRSIAVDDVLRACMCCDCGAILWMDWIKPDGVGDAPIVRGAMSRDAVPAVPIDNLQSG